MFLRALLIAVTFTIVGCANHSTPLPGQPNKIVGRTMKVWVDQDGTFYPSEWTNEFRRPIWIDRGAFSLKRMAADDSDQMAMLEKGEKDALAEYRRFLADKKRIFIFIHGFNNSEDEADHAYELMKKAIDLKQGDGVVKFYWDGLKGKGLGVLSIWFNAAGYSQLAGTKGLRRLLNATHGKEVVFITHSRGASVFLSALGDPPYDPAFVVATEDDAKRVRPKFSVYGDPALQPNNNRISAIVLAPATGRIDLTSPEHPRGGPMRKFDRQLKLVYFTVNPEDKTLRKWLNIPGKFNPTEMGVSMTAAKNIGKEPQFKYKVWDPPMKTHGFLYYVGDGNHLGDPNAQFMTMLKEMKIDVKGKK